MGIRTARSVVEITLETGSGNSLTVGPESGNWGISGLEPNFAESIDIKSRGRYVESITGDDTFPSFSIAMFHDGSISSATIGKIYDLIMGKGIYSADASTNPSGCRSPWHIKVTAVITGCDGVTDTFFMPNVRPSMDYATAKEGNTFSMTGGCMPGFGGTDPVQIS